MGVRRTTVTMWEIGKNTPKSKQLPKLARILGCTVDDLFKKEG